MIGGEKVDRVGQQPGVFVGAQQPVGVGLAQVSGSNGQQIQRRPPVLGGGGRPRPLRLTAIRPSPVCSSRAERVATYPPQELS